MAGKAKTPRFRVQRRLGLELPGLGKSGALERRPYPPGENGNKRRKFSDFALRLEEKQKIRTNYVLREQQLRRFIRHAKRGASTNWINKLCGLLELRLDNVVFRLNLAPSIKSARQLVSHGHILVNGRRLNIGSYVCRVGDVVSLKDSKKSKENQIVLFAKKNRRLDLPDYLQQKEGEANGTVLSVPSLSHVPFPFDANLFTEYYAARKA